jgi:hypothetical protein
MHEMATTDRPFSKRSFAFLTIRDVLVGAILFYGFVYTAYKYGNPLFGRNDFFKYKQMVASPFDLSATIAPFVMRQIPAIVASVFYRLGLHYDTKTVVDLIGMDADTKRRFLALILSNSLAVWMSFTILAGYLRRKLATDSVVDLFTLFGILAAWFYFPTAAFAPETVGWGWFVSVLFLTGFVERNVALTCVACAIGAFSRETTLIFAFTLFAARLVFERDRSRSNVLSILALLAACLIYIVVRKIFTTGHDNQIAPLSFVSNLTSLWFVDRQFLFQSILAQGLLVLLLVCIALREPRYAAYLLLSSVAVAAVAIGAKAAITLPTGESLPYYAAFFLLSRSSRLRGNVTT